MLPLSKWPWTNMICLAYSESLRIWWCHSYGLLVFYQGVNFSVHYICHLFDYSLWFLRVCVLYFIYIRQNQDQGMPLPFSTAPTREIKLWQNKTLTLTTGSCSKREVSWPENPRYMEWLMREALAIKLNPNNMNGRTDSSWVGILQQCNSYAIPRQRKGQWSKW